MSLKRIIVTVTNDLVSDNRVHKVCTTLAAMGFEVMLTGRRTFNTPPLGDRAYATRRMRLVFRKGPLFYAEFNLRLLVFLLTAKCDILLANDLDTLPASILAGKLRNIPVVYDSHEFFTEVPELVHRPMVRSIWQWLEKRLVPRVSAAMTVCRSIARIYSQKYPVEFEVVRNVPRASDRPETDAASAVLSDRPFIIYQGALNLGRGLETAIRAMHFIPEADLVIAGSGDLDNQLRKLAEDINIRNVIFAGRIPLEKMMAITQQASLGISIEEDLGLNYRYALPNKLFDYIQARIPVLVSDLPEMRSLVEEYGVGFISNHNNPETLAENLRLALFDENLRNGWRNNLQDAARRLTWENEEHIVEGIFRKFLQTT